MSVLQAINELPLNSDNTAAQYASFLKKFAQYVGKSEDEIQSMLPKNALPMRTSLDFF